MPHCFAASPGERVRRTATGGAPFRRVQSEVIKLFHDSTGSGATDSKLEVCYESFDPKEAASIPNIARCAGMQSPGNTCRPPPATARGPSSRLLRRAAPALEVFADRTRLQPDSRAHFDQLAHRLTRPEGVIYLQLIGRPVLNQPLHLLPLISRKKTPRTLGAVAALHLHRRPPALFIGPLRVHHGVARQLTLAVSRIETPAKRSFTTWR
jgi:hypothetical protein